MRARYGASGDHIERSLEMVGVSRTVSILEIVAFVGVGHSRGRRRLGCGVRGGYTDFSSKSSHESPEREMRMKNGGVSFLLSDLIFSQCMRT